MTGGLVILVVVFANPRTRTSEFYKLGQRPNVLNYRLSALDHPNVVQGAEVVPGATSREWVDERLDGGWCEAVPEHSEDDYTFEVPWRPGIIYRPNTEFLCALLGIPPANSSADTLIPVGRYEAACKRREKLTGTEVRMGVDVARWGDDAGTLYARHGNHCWRVAKLTKKDTTAYAGAIRQEALRLAATGTARSLHVRVDAGGGFGGGVIDQIKHDPELKAAFPDFQAFEVDFGGKAYTPKSYHLLVTELYAETAETLKGICLLNAPEELRGDLTERKYKWVNVAGIAVKQLEPKDEIRKPQRLGRSPDDGDGFVLCAAPDFLFTHKRREWTFG